MPFVIKVEVCRTLALKMHRLGFLKSYVTTFFILKCLKGSCSYIIVPSPISIAYPVLNISHIACLLQQGLFFLTVKLCVPVPGNNVSHYNSPAKNYCERLFFGSWNDEIMCFETEI